MQATWSGWYLLACAFNRVHLIHSFAELDVGDVLRLAAIGQETQLGDQTASSAGTGWNCAVPTRFPKRGPMLEKPASINPEILSSTGAGVLRKVSDSGATPHSSSAPDLLWSGKRDETEQVNHDQHAKEDQNFTPTPNPRIPYYGFSVCRQVSNGNA